MKKINIYILVILSIIIVASCSKEEKPLEPSNADKDWYKLEDSTDPVGALQYDIYEKYGLSVFVKDTIGSRNDGVGYDGKPIIYYEVLDPDYVLGAYKDVCRYTLIEDEAEQIAALNFVKDYIMPKLDKRAYPRSFLLAEVLDISRTTESYRHEEPSYRGMMVSMIGGMTDILTATEEEKNDLAAYVFSEEWTTYLLGVHGHTMESFFAVSSSLYTEGPVYERTAEEGSKYSQLPYEKLGDYGFLGYFHEERNSEDDYKTPSKKMDLQDFMYAYAKNTKEEFMAKYEDYEFIVQKYNILDNLINELDTDNFN